MGSNAVRGRKKESQKEEAERSWAGGKEGAGKYLDSLWGQSHSSQEHKGHSGAQPLQACTCTDRHGGCTQNSVSPGGHTDRLWGVGTGPS